MKKNLFMVAAVVLMALTACNKEEIAGGNPADNQTLATVEFSASFADTKTELNNEGKKTLWVEADRIDINGQEFKIKELVDGGLSAIFENVNELPVGFAAPFTAKYPYGVAEVPATQTAKAGTFDPAAVLETANSNDHNLSFTNVTSLLKFQVPAACQTVTISSTDVLAGSSAKTVTVNGPFEAGETYYAAVLPGTKANFVVRIDGYLSKNAASVTIAESTIADMKTLPAPVASDVKVKINSTSHTTYIEGNYSVLRNISIASANTYKIVSGSNEVRGVAEKTPLKSWCYLYKSSGDMKGLNGTFDIYIDKAKSSLCIVNAGEVVPQYTDANKTLYFMYQNTDWRGLYLWDSGDNKLLGDWNSCKNNRLGTFTTPGDKTCSYWAIPSSYNNVNINLIVMNNGVYQSHDTPIKFTGDTESWQSAWTDGKAELGTYVLVPFSF